VGRVRQRDVSGGILDILCSGVGLVCGWIFQLHPFLGPNYICAQNSRANGWGWSLDVQRGGANVE